MNQMFNRYAIALFSLALESNKIDEYLFESKQLVQIFEDNPELIILLKDYGVSNDEKKQAIEAIFKNKVSTDIFHFMCVIIDNKRGKYIKEIFAEFIKVCLKRLNIKSGIIYSTQTLTNKQISDIENKVSNILKSTVKLINKIDSSLIGGFKVEVEGFLLDYSISNKIEKLKDELLSDKGGKQ